LQDIEAEMARTQKNKATMSHLCALKARLASLKRLEASAGAKGGEKGEGFEVKAQGDARVAFIGFPSVGKSTLLTRLTG
jgi:ribosome-interacting GTPase 1